MMLDLLTFNVGLLRYLGALIMPAPHVDERLAALPQALRDSGADVIALQEIYEPAHCDLLASRVRDVYPYSFYPQTGWPLKLKSGLMMLSRYELVSTLHSFRAAPIDERFFADKGVLVSQLRVNSAPITILNLHTTAGGLLLRPEHFRIEEIRTHQINETLALATQDPGRIPIIVGDFNAGPEASPSNYAQFKSAHFIDTFARLNPGTVEVTWDPKNALNNTGPHRTSPRQRIDHAFVRDEDVNSTRIEPVEAQIVFQEPLVSIESGRKITLSDHYGLRVKLRVGIKS